MSHPHVLKKEEEVETTLEPHQLPVPLNWKVLVQPNQVKMQTKGGLHLPSISKDNEEYYNFNEKCKGCFDWRIWWPAASNQPDLSLTRPGVLIFYQWTTVHTGSTVSVDNAVNIDNTAN